MLIAAEKIGSNCKPVTPRDPNFDNLEGYSSIETCCYLKLKANPAAMQKCRVRGCLHPTALNPVHTG